MTVELTAHRLRDLLFYDAESGQFRWIDARPLNRSTGVAGRLHPEGYRSIKIDGRNYQSHRLAWLYVHGAWPLGQIDHINRDRSDNRMANLRDVSCAENQQNTGLSTRNKSGFRGVSWNKAIGKWNAKIGHHGKKFHLGYFADFNEAVRAYRMASASLHPLNPFGSES